MILIINMQIADIGIVCFPMFRYRKVHAFGAPKMTLRHENLRNLYENRQVANLEWLPGCLYIQKREFSGANLPR